MRRSVLAERAPFREVEVQALVVDTGAGHEGVVVIGDLAHSDVAEALLIVLLEPFLELRKRDGRITFTGLGLGKSVAARTEHHAYAMAWPFGPQRCSGKVYGR